MRNIGIINTCTYGSTGKIATGLFNYLSSDFNVHFCFGRLSGETKKNYYKIGTKLDLYIHAMLTRITGLQGFYSTIPTLKLINYLFINKIDTLYLVSLHGYYVNEKMLWDYINKKNIKIIYIMIDEYPYLGKCGYKGKCTNYLNKCRNCPNKKEYPKSLLFDKASQSYLMKEHAYSLLKDATFIGPEYTVINAKKSPLCKNVKFKILDEAIDCELFKPRESAEILNELKINKNKIIVLCVAPMSNERKGCKYYIDLARELESNDEYVFVHVGFDIKAIDLPKNYIAIEPISNQIKLAEYYSVADLFVFPSLLDTMPNACLEALACGTPLLLFDISGMPYIANEEVATFIEPKNVNEMKDVVLKTNKKTKEKVNKCRNYALSRYDAKIYFEKLLKIIDE